MVTIYKRYVCISHRREVVPYVMFIWMLCSTIFIPTDKINEKAYPSRSATTFLSESLNLMTRYLLQDKTNQIRLDGGRTTILHAQEDLSDFEFSMLLPQAVPSGRRPCLVSVLWDGYFLVKGAGSPPSSSRGSILPLSSRRLRRLPVCRTR
jgi:hypothetical protein